MIRTLNGGPGITVQGGNNSSPSFNMNSYSGTNITPGTVRYNGANYNFEVYDGYMWQVFPSNYTNVELSPETREIIEWAKAKRAQETYLVNKFKDHPSVLDLLKQKKDIDEKIEMILILLEGKSSNELDIEARQF